MSYLSPIWTQYRNGITYMHKVIHPDHSHFVWPNRMGEKSSDYEAMNEDLGTLLE
jgi:hypothetical protein